MNKVECLLTVGVIGIAILVGRMVYLDLTNELLEHPEIKEFTSPDIYHVSLVIATVLVAALVIEVIEIVMWLSKRGEEHL